MPSSRTQKEKMLRLRLKSPTDGKAIHEKWNPMKGYSGEFPSGNSPGYYYNLELDALRHWTYGGVAGLKAVVNGHYTVSFQYYESIKEIQSQCDMRDYGYQLSVGYTF